MLSFPHQITMLMEKDFTLSLHCGVKFYIVDLDAYVGGAVLKFDFFEFDMLALDQFKKVAEHEGVKQPMRAFTNVEHDGFIWIKNDTDLVKTWEEKIKFTREIHIYIEEVNRFCPYVPFDYSEETHKDETESYWAVDGEIDGVVDEGVIERTEEDGSDDILNDECTDEDNVLVRALMVLIQKNMINFSNRMRIMKLSGLQRSLSQQKQDN